MTQANTSSLTLRTLGALLWSGGGTIIQVTVKVALLLALARLLTPEDFGIISAALVVIAFSQIITQLGIGPAVVQRKELTDHHIAVGFSLSLGLGGVFLAVLFFLAEPTSRFFEMPELAEVLRVLALVVPIQALGIVASSLVQRHLNFRKYSIVEVISYCFGYGVVSIVLVLLGFGYWALVWAHVAQQSLRTALFLSTTRHPMGLKLRCREAKDLLYFGLGFSLAKIANYAANQGDNLIIGRYLTADELGEYGRGYQLMVMPAYFFGRVVDKVLFPAMAEIQTEKKRLERIFRRGISLVAIVTLPPSVFCLILAPEIILVVLGDQWHAVVPVLQVLSLGMFARTAYKVCDSLIRATGAVYKRAWRQYVYAAFILIGAFVGASAGITGVAWGVLFAVIVNYLLLAQLSIAETKSTWGKFFAAHGTGLLLAAISVALLVPMVIALRSTTTPDLVITVVSGVWLIAGLAIALWALSKTPLSSEIRWLVGAFRRLFFEKNKSPAHERE